MLVYTRHPTHTPEAPHSRARASWQKPASRAPSSAKMPGLSSAPWVLGKAHFTIVKGRQDNLYCITQPRKRGSCPKGSSCLGRADRAPISQQQVPRLLHPSPVLPGLTPCTQPQGLSKAAVHREVQPGESCGRVPVGVPGGPRAQPAPKTAQHSAHSANCRSKRKKRKRGQNDGALGVRRSEPQPASRDRAGQGWGEARVLLQAALALPRNAPAPGTRTRHDSNLFSA